MNKILLVQQYLGSNQEVGPVFPIGLAYLATNIANTDWEVKVLDLNVYESPYDILELTIDSFFPDVVGLSIRNIDNVDFDNFNYFYKEIKTIIRAIKRTCNNLVVGGAGFSIFAQEIMIQNKEIDYGIVQEGEETIVELLQCIANNRNIATVKGLYYWDNGNLLFSGERRPINFSKSEIPNRSLFEIEKYNKPLCIGVQTKRGCSLKCSYCTYPYLNKHTERFRDPSSVVDEIYQLVNVMGIKEIIFCDDIFNNPLEHSIRIIKGIIDRNIQVRWSAWFDVGSTDLDFIRLAIKSGCYRFCFSIEGVVDSSLKLLQKNFTTKQADNLIKICFSSNEFKHIDFRFSLFAMPPGQTLYGMFKTLIIIYKIHVRNLNSKCLVSWIRILPNTDLYNSIISGSINLLPEEVTVKNKELLFYQDSRINRFLIYMYKHTIRLVLVLRRIKKATLKLFR